MLSVTPGTNFLPKPSGPVLSVCLEWNLVFFFSPVDMAGRLPKNSGFCCISTWNILNNVLKSTGKGWWCQLDFTGLINNFAFNKSRKRKKKILWFKSCGLIFSRLYKQPRGMTVPCRKSPDCILIVFLFPLVTWCGISLLFSSLFNKHLRKLQKVLLAANN